MVKSVKMGEFLNGGGERPWGFDYTQFVSVITNDVRWSIKFPSINRIVMTNNGQIGFVSYQSSSGPVTIAGKVDIVGYQIGGISELGMITLKAEKFKQLHFDEPGIVMDYSTVSSKAVDVNIILANGEKIHARRLEAGRFRTSLLLLRGDSEIVVPFSELKSLVVSTNQVIHVEMKSGTKSELKVDQLSTGRNWLFGVSNDRYFTVMWESVRSMSFSN